jgi:flagellar M-ring protein FliF
VTKHTIHSEEGPGRVRRVTAAVVVNDRSLMEGSGKTQHTVWKPRNAEEMRRLEQLAQAAVGFDLKRGDQVVVENVSFSSNSPETKPPALEQALEQARSLARTQPGLAKTAILGLCGILLVLCVLRPMARQMVATLREPAMLPAGVEVAALGRGAEVESLQAGAIPVLTTRELSQHQAIYAQVADHIRREPAHSTRLIEAWIGSSEESR